MSVNMGQRHKYEYPVNLNDDNRASTKVVRMVGQGRRVLELGAGPGTITQLLKNQAGCIVTAVEIDDEALSRLAPFCERVFQLDLNDPAWTEGLARPDGFEVIVAADVFEHLLDPWSTLAALKPLLAPDGSVVISLPHAGHNAVVAALLNGDFRYHEWGLLDRTHIRFFGIKNIEDLFDSAGYVIEEVDYVRFSPDMTELADLWRNLSKNIKQALSESPYGDIYQVVIKARPRRPGMSDGLRLTSPAPITWPIKTTIQAWLRLWLPSPIRRGIVRLLSTLELRH